MLNKILSGKRDFIRDTNETPTKVHLTADEMKSLSDDLRGMVVFEREKDLKERLRPDLLPPMRETPEVTVGCMIYGLAIVETDIPGLHFET